MRGRTEATGRGAFFALREVCHDVDVMKRLELSTGLEGKRIVVQGLGNVGYHVARFCREAGGVIVAIAEYDGAIVSAGGLDPVAVKAHQCETGSIPGFPGARDLTPSAAALELDCDILVPAALENVLTEDNAASVKARIVLEGVIVSYFEWLKNLSHVRFGRMERRLEEHDEASFVSALERLTGKTLTDAERSRLVRDPTRRTSSTPGSRM